MPKFFNGNKHRVYVDKPGDGLVRIASGGEVTGEDEFADNLRATPGVHLASSDEGKQAKERLELHAKLVEHGGLPLSGDGASNDSGSVDPDDFTKKELATIADERGVEVASNANKQELADAINESSSGTVTTADLPSQE